MDYYGLQLKMGIIFQMMENFQFSNHMPKNVWFDISTVYFPNSTEGKDYTDIDIWLMLNDTRIINLFPNDDDFNLLELRLHVLYNDIADDSYIVSTIKDMYQGTDLSFYELMYPTLSEKLADYTNILPLDDLKWSELTNS